MILCKFCNFSQLSTQVFQPLKIVKKQQFFNKYQLEIPIPKKASGMEAYKFRKIPRQMS
jgi:hypothetical protein